MPSPMLLLSFDTNLLFASLVWGAIGMGYFVYGKRQKSIVPWLGGVAILAASYFADSVLVMSLICVALIIATHWLVRQGY
jgi:hypothetical protein